MNHDLNDTFDEPTLIFISLDLFVTLFRSIIGPPFLPPYEIGRLYGFLCFHLCAITQIKDSLSNQAGLTRSILGIPLFLQLFATAKNRYVRKLSQLTLKPNNHMRNKVRNGAKGSASLAKIISQNFLQNLFSTNSTPNLPNFSCFICSFC